MHDFWSNNGGFRMWCFAYIIQSCYIQLNINSNTGTFLYYDSMVPKGKAQIRDVEFYHTGQEGWTDYTDPRYSLAFLNLGMVRKPQNLFTRPVRTLWVLILGC